MDGVCVLMIDYYRWEVAPFYTLNIPCTFFFLLLSGGDEAAPKIQNLT
jgi:hypothetical protein